MPQAVKSVAADRAAKHREHSMAAGTILAPAEPIEHHLEAYQHPGNGSSVPPGYVEGPGLSLICQPQPFPPFLRPCRRLVIKKHLPPQSAHN